MEHWRARVYVYGGQGTINAQRQETTEPVYEGAIKSVPIIRHLMNRETARVNTGIRPGLLLSIVEELDVIEDRRPCVGPRWEVAMVGELVL